MAGAPRMAPAVHALDVLVGGSEEFLAPLELCGVGDMPIVLGQVAEVVLAVGAAQHWSRLRTANFI